MGADPYVDPRTGVLRNRLGISDADELNTAEAAYTRRRIRELIQHPAKGSFDLAHLQTIHRHIAQDVYDWAGKVRTVDIAKGSQFCLVQHIGSYAAQVFADLAASNRLAGLGHDEFVAALAHFYGDVNALHPFREVNGRTQRAFMSQLAHEATWHVAWERMDPERNIAASIASFEGDEALLRAMLHDLVEPWRPGGDGSGPPTLAPPHGPVAPESLNLLESISDAAPLRVPGNSGTSLKRHASARGLVR